MKWLYTQGELISMHAEGTRNPNSMNPINMTLIDYTRQIKEELGMEIPLILIGTYYENLKKFRSKIKVNINRLNWNNNLEQAIFKELAILSNIKS